GHGCAPIGNPVLARSNIYGCLAGHDIPWRSMGEYLDRLAAARPAVNVASLVANGNLRLASAGLVDRPSSPTELRQMKKLLEQSRGRGLDVGFDMHPRSFGTTNLSAALPPWAVQGDKAAVAARLRDPAFRRELRAYRSILTSLARGDWSRIVLFDSRAQPELSRRSIADISAERGIEPLDAVCDI